MNKIAWSQDLTVGVAEIDEQHQQWIGRLNDVAAAVAAHMGPVQLGQTLEFLVDYTQKHFVTEEKLMAAAHYPGLPEQLAQHQELTATRRICCATSRKRARRKSWPRRSTTTSATGCSSTSANST